MRMEEKKLLYKIQIDPDVKADTNTEVRLRARAENLRLLLAGGESDIAAGKVRSARLFLEEFKSDHNIS
jgi:hypothetical protein